MKEPKTIRKDMRAVTKNNLGRIVGVRPGPEM